MNKSSHTFSRKKREIEKRVLMFLPKEYLHLSDENTNNNKRAKADKE